MGRGIGQIMEALGQLLPPWVVIALLAVLVVALAPSWLETTRQRQVRARVRRAVRVRSRREQDLAAAVELAAGRPRRLVTLAEEAIRFQLTEVRDRALAELEASGGHPKDLQRLRKQIEAEDRPPTHPLEEVARVGQMLEAGAVERARARWEQATEVFPDDPDLRALGERLDR